jgi:hypothetical protein
MQKLIALAALGLLAGCASNNVCVQPDPVQPVSGAWNKGVDAGTGIQPVELNKAK